MDLAVKAKLIVSHQLGKLYRQYHRLERYISLDTAPPGNQTRIHKDVGGQNPDMQEETNQGQGRTCPSIEESGRDSLSISKSKGSVPAGRQFQKHKKS